MEKPAGQSSGTAANVVKHLFKDSFAQKDIAGEFLAGTEHTSKLLTLGQKLAAVTFVIEIEFHLRGFRGYL
jgi:hypothetical protein